MPFVDHYGLRRRYRERGDDRGEPIVLVHGLLWSSRLFHRLAELFPDHRVLLIDLRGHATSDTPTDPSASRWSKLASDGVGLLDHVGIERPVVGGRRSAPTPHWPSPEWTPRIEGGSSAARRSLASRSGSR